MTEPEVQTADVAAPEFVINPVALYSRAALDRALAGLMDVETFLLRTRPKKRFKSAWWGEDLIAAVNSAPAIGEGGPAEIVPVTGPIGDGAHPSASIRGCPPGLEPLDPKKIN